MTAMTAVPQLDGNWISNVEPNAKCRIEQKPGSQLARLTNGNGIKSPATVSGGLILAHDWRDLSGATLAGAISEDGRRIDWENQTFWTKE